MTAKGVLLTVRAEMLWESAPVAEFMLNTEKVVP